MISRAIATIIAVLSDLLTLPRRTISTRHRVLHWELPRLLSAIERLDIVLRRDLAAEALYPSDDGDAPGSAPGDSVDRLQRYKARVIRNDLSIVVEQADRIKAILGYDIR